MDFVSPSIELTAFNCPYCKAYSYQIWYSVHPGEKFSPNTHSSILNHNFHFPYISEAPEDFYSPPVINLMVSLCYNCKGLSIWVYDRMVFPFQEKAPPANTDMPDKILKIYNEASSILHLSPKGAAALIRLALQILIIHLGYKGENLNQDISELVAKGMKTEIQKALDIVRVIGNNAVHPGKIDLSDDQDTALTLFKLLNLITEELISRPKKVSELYNNLPEENRKAIEKRDKSDNERDG